MARKVVGGGKFVLDMTDAWIAILEPVFTAGSPSFIAFPWAKIIALPRFPVPITVSDLNAPVAVRRFVGGSPAAGADHLIDAEGNQGHIIRRPAPDGRLLIAGVFWSDGRVMVDVSLAQRPEVAREVLSAELAHAVDYGLPLSEAQHGALMRLFHPGGPDAHTWWEVHSYSAEYYLLLGESFMALFTHAYSAMIPWQDPFVHKSTKAMAPSVYTILGIPPVGSAPPPPPPPPPEEPGPMPDRPMPIYALPQEVIGYDTNMNKGWGHGNRNFRLGGKVRCMVQDLTPDGAPLGSIAIRIFSDTSPTGASLNPVVVFGLFVLAEGSEEQTFGDYLLPANQNIKVETTWSSSSGKNDDVQLAGTTKKVDVSFPDAVQLAVAAPAPIPRGIAGTTKKRRRT